MTKKEIGNKFFDDIEVLKVLCYLPEVIGFYSLHVD